MTLPIRVRLALLSGALMAGLIVALGTFLYLRLEADMIDAVDDELEARAAAIEEGWSGGPLPGRPADVGDVFAQLVARDGTVVASSPGLAAGTSLAPANVASLTTVRFFETIVETAEQQIPGRLLARPGAGGHVLVVGQSIEDQRASLGDMRLLLTGLGVVAVALALGIGWLLAGAALRPVERMRRAAEEVSGTELAMSSQRGSRRSAIGFLVTIALAATACTQPSPFPSTSPRSTSAPPSSVAASPSPSPSPAARIEQASPPPGVTIAPDSARVDLLMPTFSDPTAVTNPLFPVSEQRSVLLLGTVEDLPFRTEVTLLPETRIIDWNGQQIETLVSQYVAFLDGRLHEVAYDYYAQADDGSVWYFGEDVFNFEDGSIVDTHGSWLAGRDGPAGMIMPAEPQVGDVYRPENVPGLVFEEVTVTAVDQTLDGPFGPIAGSLLIRELHADGETEDKSFAPGYGEFYTAAGGEVEALAMAVPTDAAAGDVPAALADMTDASRAAYEAARTKDWSAAADTVARVKTSWAAYSAGQVPARVRPILETAVAELAEAVEGQRSATAAQAAIDVARSSLDLQLRYRPTSEVDVARYAVWADQLVLDAAADDLDSVRGDVFAMDYVRDRVRASLGPNRASAIDTLMEELNTAVGDEDADAAAAAAKRSARSWSSRGRDGSACTTDSCNDVASCQVIRLR